MRPGDRSVCMSTSSSRARRAAGTVARARPFSAAGSTSPAMVARSVTCAHERVESSEQVRDRLGEVHLLAEPGGVQEDIRSPAPRHRRSPCWSRPGRSPCRRSPANGRQPCHSATTAVSLLTSLRGTRTGLHATRLRTASSNWRSPTSIRASQSRAPGITAGRLARTAGGRRRSAEAAVAPAPAAISAPHDQPAVPSSEVSETRRSRARTASIGSQSSGSDLRRHEQLAEDLLLDGQSVEHAPARSRPGSRRRRRSACRPRARPAGDTAVGSASGEASVATSSAPAGPRHAAGTAACARCRARLVAAPAARRRRGRVVVRARRRRPAGAGRRGSASRGSGCGSGRSRGRLLTACAGSPGRSPAVVHRLVLRDVVDHLVEAEGQEVAEHDLRDRAVAGERQARGDAGDRPSLIGVARTRSGKSVLSPRVTLNAPPYGSTMSSPRMTTRGSASSRRRRASPRTRAKITVRLASATTAPSARSTSSSMRSRSRSSRRRPWIASGSSARRASTSSAGRLSSFLEWWQSRYVWMTRTPGPRACASVGDRLAGGLLDLQHVGAVDLGDRQPEGGEAPGDAARQVQRARRALRPAVVLEHHEQRQVPQRREVQGLVDDALAERAVADEDTLRSSRAAQLLGERDPGRGGHGPALHAVGLEARRAEVLAAADARDTRRAACP